MRAKIRSVKNQTLPILLLLLVLLLVGACRTTTGPATPAYDIAPQVSAAKAVMARPDVAAAMTFVDGDRERIVAEWMTLTAIPATSGQEAKRGDEVERIARASGLEVSRDAAGNVIAVRKGTGGGTNVVFDAHLDTVFAMETNVTPHLENGRIHAPGVGDNTRNVESLLAMIRAMDAAQVVTRGDVTFLFTVEEETNFRGIRQFLVEHGSTVGRFVALDGGFGDFTYGGIGIYWQRFHFLGPGGHTRSSSPPYSAALPLARAIDRIYALEIPRRAWINVGMLGGADVFNAKAADAWMSVDLRSTDPETLHSLDARIETIVREEARRVGMQMRREQVSKSEVASIAGHRTSPMVLTTEGVWRAFGFDPAITATASNHSSVALLAGIPAISTGVAPCRASHALDESCEVNPILTGIKRNVVLAVALTE